MENQVSDVLARRSMNVIPAVVEKASCNGGNPARDRSGAVPAIRSARSRCRMPMESLASDGRDLVTLRPGALPANPAPRVMRALSSSERSGRERTREKFSTVVRIIRNAVIFRGYERSFLFIRKRWFHRARQLRWPRAPRVYRAHGFAVDPSIHFPPDDFGAASSTHTGKLSPLGMFPLFSQEKHHE